MRRHLTLAGTVCIALALFASPAAAQSEPSVTITPATALEDGDLVDVVGSGFAPSTTVFLLLCNDETRLGDAVGRCALIGSGNIGYEVNTVGAFNAADVAIPVGQVGATPLATCPPSAAQAARGVSCSITVAEADLTQVAGATITYEGQPPGPADELAFTGPQQAWLGWLAVSLTLVGMMLWSSGRFWERRRLQVVSTAPAN